MELHPEDDWATAIPNSKRTPCNSSSTGFTSSDVRVRNNASDNLTTAQTHEGTPNPVDVNSQDRPSLIDVNGFGRPREFSLARKRISNRGQSWREQNLEFILQQMCTVLMDLTSGEANDMVDNSRKNPLEVWRRLQKQYDPTARRKEEEHPSHNHFSGTLFSPGTPSGI